MRRCPRSPGSLLRVVQSSVRGFLLIQGYSGTTQPQGHGRPSPSSPCTASAEPAAAPGRHETPRDQGTPLCPQMQHGEEVGGSSPWPLPRRAPGMRTRDAWCRQRGCRWDAASRRSQVKARQKARGSLSPRAGTRAQGASTIPWQTPSRLPGLARAQEVRQSPGRDAGITGHSRHLPAHFLPLPAGCQPLPAPSTPAPLALLCQVPPGMGQLHPSCPAWLLAAAKLQAEEGNRPWGSPCTYPPPRSSEGQQR